MSKTLNIILIIIILGVISLAVLLQPETDIKKYWMCVGWVVFLIFINWLTSEAIFGGANKEKTGQPGSNLGILPSI